MADAAGGAGREVLEGRQLVSLLEDDPRATAAVFARLAQDLHGESGVTETVGAVLDFARQSVGCCEDPGCCEAGVLLRAGDGRFETAAVTDPVVEKVDGLHTAGGRGPIHALVVQGREAVMVWDTAGDERWPVWMSTVADLGLRSAMAVRLGAGRETIGVLQVFSRTPFAFEQADVDVANLIAQHAAIALATARQTASLRRAVDGRTLVGQAQGILMERFGTGEGEAFDHLRRYSQEKNVKLRDVARHLIDTGRFPA